MDQLIGTLGVPVANHSLNHAAQRDAGRLDVPASHLFPTSPHAVNILCVAIRFDEATECVGSIHCHAIVALQLLELCCQEVWLADAYTCLNHRREEHLIHGLLHSVDQLHSHKDVSLIRVGVQALQKDGASDLIRLDACCFHLRDDVPRLSTPGLATFGYHGIDQLIEGDAIRLEALFLHLLHDRSCFVKVLIHEVGLDERVERHDVCHASLLRLLHPSLRCLEISALDASIQHRVVDDAIQINSTALQGVEDALRSLQVALCCAVPHHRDVLCHIRWRRVQ
mmetsp:Transcript_113515/g.201269  ORF Transcript_113515/g.201269 Transcript_113515/m.201269 type:complete len:282 (+) Transcript_113515:1260-2105(+)